MRKLRGLGFAVVLAGCGSLVVGCGGEVDGGMSISTTQEGLKGCAGRASSTIPASGSYFLTSFGFSPSDDGLMSCGEKTLHGSWYYAASRQRYGCGAHIKIEANGKCVVAETDDYGPDVCVENAAGRPIIDASPLVSEHLFGVKSAGYSDRLAIRVTEVSKSTPLGPCSSSTGTGTAPPPSPPPPPSSSPPPSDPPPTTTPPPSHPDTSCFSATLDVYVDEGTCVQSASDEAWYTCEAGAWVAGQNGCTASYPWCHSDTLAKDVPPRTCVQSKFDQTWYQCDAGQWSAGVTDGAGTAGTCASEYSL